MDIEASLKEALIQNDLALLDERLTAVKLSGWNINTELKHGRYQGSILHLAVALGGSQTVELILRHGANANSVDNNKSTPLHVAFRLAAHDAVEILIANGANPNLENYQKETPISNARGSRSHEIVLNMVKSNKIREFGEKALVDASRIAVWNRDVEALKKLVGAGLKVRSWHLQAACIERDYDMIRYLLKKGANPHAKLRGATCIKLLAAKGDAKIIKKFIDLGVDINAGSRFLSFLNHVTPLESAIHSGNLPVIKLLISNGADRSGLKMQHWRKLIEIQPDNRAIIAEAIIATGGSIAKYIKNKKERKAT